MKPAIYITANGEILHHKEEVKEFLAQNDNMRVFNSSERKCIIFKHGNYEVWQYEKPYDSFHKEPYVGKDFDIAFNLLNGGRS